MTAAASESFSVLRYDPRRVPSEVRAMAPREVLERWQSADRSAQQPRIVVALSPLRGTCLGAALVTSRPHAAYLKIVDVVGSSLAVSDAVIDYAAASGSVQVKWEVWSVGDAPGEVGFTPLAPPASVAPGQPHTGYVRWLTNSSGSEPAYYQQTTHFSCAAAAGLMARTAGGPLEPGDVSRVSELMLWRDATNFPACEPLGLGLALHHRWPASEVSVFLDADGPVLLDHLPEEERQWRAVLQRVSRAEARTVGLPVVSTQLTMKDIRNAVQQHGRFLLLISLKSMLGFDVPHWVLCHGATSDGAFVLEDPWVAADQGETWVDSHMLPVTEEVLGRISVMGETRYRGAVLIR